MEIVIIIIFLVVFTFWLIQVYNRLIKFRSNTENSWSKINIQLVRRHDLIPNLVETVRGYSSHEKETLERVTEARKRAVQSDSIDKKISSESQLSKALGRLMVVVESYPEIKADSRFATLQSQLDEIEKSISIARNYYNDNVVLYKNNYESFPTILAASLLRFKKPTFFSTESDITTAPQVKFK